MKKFLFLIIFLNLSLVLAQGIVVCSQPPCTWQDFVQTIANLIRTIVLISFWIAFLIVAIGAFLIMFGGPKPELIKRGHEMIWTAIWAYVLILFGGILFDIILEFFSPRFALALIAPWPPYDGPSYDAQLEPKTFYNPLKETLMAGLKCGMNAPPIFNSPSLGRLIACLFEAIGLLNRVVLPLLAFAIIASALYLITTPLFGFGQISKAYKILIWSIVGFLIILLAELIRDQITKILK